MSNNLFFGSLILNGFLTSSLSSKIGIVASISSIFASFIIQTFTKRNPCESLVAKWIRQISFCCLISVSSVSLSDYLEFYDSGNFVHFVPTISMPLLMPILAVCVIALLVFFGLENSDVLNTISGFGFFLSASIFGIVALFRSNLQNLNFPDDFSKKFLNGVLLWNSSFYSFNKKIQFLTPNIYVALTVLLCALPSRKVDILTPLGDFYGIYKLIQVPLVSSCLGLALYSFFVPAVDFFFDIEAQMKPNEATDKKSSILNTSLTSIILMYFYNIEDLIVLSNSFYMLAQFYESGVDLLKLYKPRAKIKGLKTKNKYDRVKSDESPIFNESESSSDTDIDAAVEEYEANLKVLTPNERNSPTIFSWILFLLVITTITILTLLSSYTLANHHFLISSLSFSVIVTLSSILVFLPKNKEKSSLECMKELFVCVSSMFFLRAIFIKMAPPTIIWMITGAFMRYKKKRKVSPKQNLSVVQGISFPLEILPRRVQSKM